MFAADIRFQLQFLSDYNYENSFSVVDSELSLLLSPHSQAFQNIHCGIYQLDLSSYKEYIQLYI